MLRALLTLIVALGCDGIASADETPSSSTNSQLTRSAAGAVDSASVFDSKAGRTAVQLGLKIIEKSGRNYPKHRQCFSCHHQTLPILAAVTARDHGFDIDAALLQKQAEFTHESFASRLKQLRNGAGIGGNVMTVGYGLWALEVADWPSNETTTAMVSYLLQRQNKNGSWDAHRNRPPLTQSPFTGSILSAYYMQKYAIADQDSKVQQATSRAKEWFLKTEPKSREDQLSLLGALALLGGSDEEISAVKKAILDAQNADGGWGQLRDMKSDSYSTGFALFTLNRVRVPTSHEAVRRGVDFLLKTQRDDGSWFVETRAKPVQKFFDNDDPHGKHQFISIAGTAWATTAISLMFPRREYRRF